MNIVLIFRIFGTYRMQLHSMRVIGVKQRMNTTVQFSENLPMTFRVEDLMPILGIGRNTAYRLVRSGEIRSIKVGRQIRIPRQVLLDYLEQK